MRALRCHCCHEWMRITVCCSRLQYVAADYCMLQRITVYCDGTMVVGAPFAAMTTGRPPHTFSLTHIHIHSLSLTHAHTHTLSHALSHTHALRCHRYCEAYTHPLSHTHVRTFSLPLSLSLTHTHAITQTHTDTHTNPSLLSPLWGPCTLSHIYTHTLSPPQTHAHTYSHIHTPSAAIADERHTQTPKNKSVFLGCTSGDSLKPHRNTQNQKKDTISKKTLFLSESGNSLNKSLKRKTGKKGPGNKRLSLPEVRLEMHRMQEIACFRIEVKCAYAWVMSHTHTQEYGKSESDLKT